LRDAEVTPASKTIAEMLDRLPDAPGVYIMKDRRGKPVYIGKAQSLRVRVRQYFQAGTSDNRDFVPLLESLVGDIETVVTGSEKEALLLENTLIKRQQPRFNVNLRDDKSFLVLRLDPAGEWPRLEVVRRIVDDGAHYFGPYHSASACREALRVVNRHFQLRTCTDHVLHHRRRPCLQYQIKRCPAPCVLPVPAAEYADQVRDVRLFLDGKSDELMMRLSARMKDAAGRTDFERAGDLRDQIRALETTLESQRVVSTDFVDQDVVGFHREGLALEMVVMSVRQGKLVGSRSFSFGGQEFPDAELLSSFVGLYYDMGVIPADEVLLPFTIADAALKAEWLTEKRPAGRRKVEVLVPQRGARRALCELARKNAAASFATRRNAREDADVILGKLQRRLKLIRLPRVVECYDVSHIQGFATVASMVVFVDGRPEKARYRTFNVRTAAGPDDFASLYEVMSRRFRRAREGAAGWELPDLVVIDGGKGQLGMALAAARDVNIDMRPGATGLAIVGLAKDPDRVFLAHAKDAIPIRPNTAEMFVLQALRDEAHRFAVSFHRAQRKRRTLRSALSDVPGVGPARQRALLRTFGSLKKIREASAEELGAVAGVGPKAGAAVYVYLASLPDEPRAEEPTIGVGALSEASAAAAGSTEPATTAESAATDDAVESAFAEVEAEAGNDDNAEEEGPE